IARVLDIPAKRCEMKEVDYLDQGVDLVPVEVVHLLHLASLGWYVEHTGDDRGVFGVTQCREAEERADGREPGVAGADAVVAFLLEVVEEGDDRRRVEVG